MLRPGHMTASIVQFYALIDWFATNTGMPAKWRILHLNRPIERLA